jgi:hypothetical protein
MLGPDRQAPRDVALVSVRNPDLDLGGVTDEVPSDRPGVKRKRRRSGTNYPAMREIITGRLTWWATAVATLPIAA